MTIRGTITFLVKSINENGYVMDVKYESLNMSMQFPQGSMEFNSEKNDANDIFSTILGSMTNRTFEITMSKTGKVTDIKNIEILWESAINQFDQVPEVQKEQMKAQVMKAYGAEALKGNIEMVTAIFPGHKVSKRDKWDITTQLESGMPALMTTEYEFAGQGPGYILIKGKSKIKTEDKDAYIETDGMPMKYDLSGSMTSEIKVDKNTGWIIDAKINQEIQGDTYIKRNGQIANDMKIPIHMVNEMEITNK